MTEDDARHPAEIEASDDMAAAVAAAEDALADMMTRAAILRGAIRRGHLCGADAVEAVEGLRRQSERLVGLGGQFRGAMRKAAAAR